jgi:1,4-dihydroxy-2-naphthoyl-CoA hydrolase
MWFRQYTLNDLNDLSSGTMGQHIGIEFTEIGPDFLVARMPVDARTRQPAGLLHGGASVALSETLGSVGAWMCLDLEKYYPVGLEINANHIRPVTKGYVSGKASPIHIGKTTHIWEIRISSEQGKLVCISRITLAVLKK